jgi:hypothetical protein
MYNNLNVADCYTVVLSMKTSCIKHEVFVYLQGHWYDKG